MLVLKKERLSQTHTHTHKHTHMHTHIHTQDGVDAHMRSVGSPLAMSAVLGGTFAQQVICREGPYRSERDDEFLQISVDVRGKGGLEKSLESYVQVSELK